MMFLSGVFFPLEQLPTWVATMAQWLPLNHAVALVRPLFMDQWPQNVAWHAGILVAYGAIGFWVALALTRKRFRA
jgi:lipooligosaccharide transport system permease protein